MATRNSHAVILFALLVALTLSACSKLISTISGAKNKPGGTAELIGGDNECTYRINNINNKFVLPTVDAYQGGGDKSQAFDFTTCPQTHPGLCDRLRLPANAQTAANRAQFAKTFFDTVGSRVRNVLAHLSVTNLECVSGGLSANGGSADAVTTFDPADPVGTVHIKMNREALATGIYYDAVNQRVEELQIAATLLHEAAHAAYYMSTLNFIPDILTTAQQVLLAPFNELLGGANLLTTTGIGLVLWGRDLGLHEQSRPGILALSPGPVIDFQRNAPSVPTSRAIALMNLGDTEVSQIQFTPFASSAFYFVGSTCGAKLAKGAACTVTVGYNVSYEGQFSDNLEVKYVSVGLNRTAAEQVKGQTMEKTWAFGGMFSQLYRNPLSGTSGCPQRQVGGAPGYGEALIAYSQNVDTGLEICYGTQPEFWDDVDWDFGGLIGSHASGTYFNYAANAYGCPSGYNAAQVYGAPGSYGGPFPGDNGVWICYRPHTKGVRGIKFEGAWGNTDVNTYFNPIGGGYCPHLQNQFLGSSGMDWFAYFCFAY